MRARLAVWVALGLALWPGPGRAGMPVPIRAETHPGLSRLVFDFPRWVGWRMQRRGDVIRLRFSLAMPFGPPPALPPGIVALADGPGWARVTVAHDARVRRMHQGLRLVLDVAAKPTPPLPLPPAPLVLRRRGPPRQVAHAIAGTGVGTGGAATPSPTPAAAPAGKPAPASGTAPSAPSTAAGSPAPPAAPPSSAAGPRATVSAAATPPAGPNQALPVYGPPAPGPVALSARPAAPPPGSPGAMLVPFEPGVAAAAFGRARQGVVVFDVARPIDLGALAGTRVFGTATVRVLPGATELVMTLPRGIRLALSHQSAGWLVALAHHTPAAAAVRPLPTAAGLRLPTPAPGREVSLLDPETGAPLLVGTERGAPAGVRVTYRAPQFALLRSWRGVAVEALSDRLALRPARDGFLLTARGGLALTPGGPDAKALADAALLTRSFHFPDLSTAALAERLRHEFRAAAARPPLARGPRLRRAAETMIALGMGAEAHALLHLAAAEDPAEAEAPDHAGLAAVAAMLAGFPARAGAIDSRTLPGSDEVAFWQAIRRAQTDPASPRAAQLLAATAPLALTYPTALRRA
ncbi:MAG: hypothetical protein ACP5NP_10255, partial [Acetobacteraceae bacterium]